MVLGFFFFCFTFIAGIKKCLVYDSRNILFQSESLHHGVVVLYLSFSNIVKSQIQISVLMKILIL